MKNATIMRRLKGVRRAGILSVEKLRRAVGNRLEELVESGLLAKVFGDNTIKNLFAKAVEIVAGETVVLVTEAYGVRYRNTKVFVVEVKGPQVVVISNRRKSPLIVNMADLKKAA